MYSQSIKSLVISVLCYVQGQAFINDFNLGRYWPVAGPQKTLYVPATVLKPHPQLNVLVILELIESPCGNDLSQCKATLVDTPDIGATPSKARTERGH